MKTFNKGNKVRLINDWEAVADAMEEKRGSTAIPSCGPASEIAARLGNATDLTIEKIDSDGDIYLTKNTAIYADCLELSELGDNSEEHY